MDARTAILNAKRQFSDIFQDEQIADIGLEEVRIDDRTGNWLITLGFARLSEESDTQALARMTGGRRSTNRYYKIVELDKTMGELVAITNRN